MKTRVALAVALGCCAWIIGGCSSNKDTTAAAPADTAPKQASMGIVNSKCPVMLSHEATTKTTVDYKGKKVGLCCGGCAPTWDKMTDAQKDEALKKAM